MNREKFINIADDIGECIGSKYSKTLQKEDKLDLGCFYSLKWLK